MIELNEHVANFVYVDSNNGCILIDEHEVKETITYHCDSISDIEYHLSLYIVHDIVLIVSDALAQYINNKYGIIGY